MTFRVVLDTNVVLSAMLFDRGRLAWLRHAWRQQRVRPLVCRDTVKELLRVLAYPKFKLTAVDQRRLVEDLLSCAEVISLPQQWPDLPLCRDAHDQVFLVLAHVGEADALISGDADLLSMRGRVQSRILTAEELEMYVNNVIQDSARRNYEWCLTQYDRTVSVVVS